MQTVLRARLSAAEIFENALSQPKERKLVYSVLIMYRISYESAVIKKSEAII